MNISAPSSIDTSSSLTQPSSSDTLAPKDAAPPIRGATNGPSLWRSILDTHGKEILECASDQFLDLATALRLKTINARDLVSLLAKAGRLGFRETDVVEDETVGPLTHEADEGLSTSFAPNLPGERTSQGRSDSTASPQPSPIEPSRELKRRKLDKYGNEIRRRGGVRVRGPRLTSAMASGKSGPGPGIKVGRHQLDWRIKDWMRKKPTS